MRRQYGLALVKLMNENDMKNTARIKSSIKHFAHKNNISLDSVFFQEPGQELFKQSRDRADRFWEVYTGSFECILREVSSDDALVFTSLYNFIEITGPEGFDLYLDLIAAGKVILFVNTPFVTPEKLNAFVEEMSEEQDTDATKRRLMKILLTAEYRREKEEWEKRRKDIMVGKEKNAAKGGHKVGTLDKMTPELEADLILHIEKDPKAPPINLLVETHHISRNTYYKYLRFLEYKRKGEKKE